MKTELFYFDDCPSWQQALENLKRALELEQLPDEVEMIQVTDPADAQAKRFVGSPTIRIDGTDVEGPDAETHGYAYGCRVYAGGVVILDETGFVKKGKASAGVARQYCRSLGQVENAQVGVFAAYASRHGYAFLDKRLFMPEVWFSAAYAERRTNCHVPKELGFQSKAQLAAAILRAISKAERMPFKYVVVDGLYGNSPDLLDAIDTGVGVTALAAIPGDTRCWLQAPGTEDKTYRYKGEVHSKRVVVASAPAPSPVAALAASLPTSSWYRRQVSRGPQGAIEYEFARKRVTLCQDGLPDRTVWLVIKRTLGAQPS